MASQLDKQDLAYHTAVWLTCISEEAQEVHEDLPFWEDEFKQEKHWPRSREVQGFLCWFNSLSVRDLKVPSENARRGRDHWIQSCRIGENVKTLRFQNKPIERGNSPWMKPSRSAEPMKLPIRQWSRFLIRLRDVFAKLLEALGRHREHRQHTSPTLKSLALPRVRRHVHEYSFAAIRSFLSASKIDD